MPRSACHPQSLIRAFWGSYMSGKFNFFQGQGVVREFCDVSGKNEILQEMSRNFTFQPDEAMMFGPDVIFFLIFIKFAVWILSGKFEFMWGKSQGILGNPKYMNPAFTFCLQKHWILQNLWMETRSSLIWVFTVCVCQFVRIFGVRNFRTFTTCTCYCLGLLTVAILMNNSLAGWGGPCSSLFLKRNSLEKKELAKNKIFMI